VRGSRYVWDASRSRGIRAVESGPAAAGLPHSKVCCAGLTGYAHISSLSALNTGPATAFARTPTDPIRADAERLSHIVMEMQRCFVLRLCKELAPGNVSFPQFFLLAYLDRKEVLTMSAIAQKMGHTTAAASGLVARLENLGYVMRSVAPDDRRKVMVCITPKGSTLVRRIREEMVGNLMKILNHLTPDEQKAWLQIYSKIYDYCQSK
jgi:DNA-binding MarR family transcriptional regulator